MTLIRTDRMWDLSQPIFRDAPAWAEYNPPGLTRNYRRQAEGFNAETLTLTWEIDVNIVAIPVLDPSKAGKSNSWPLPSRDMSSGVPRGCETQPSPSSIVFQANSDTSPHAPEQEPDLETQRDHASDPDEQMTTTFRSFAD
jgi:hypothetical protein